MNTTSTGYLDVNGVHLYYETYGDDDRSPLVLLHAGVLSIDLSFAALLPDLAARHHVVAVELQGHGRTADTERAFTPAGNAADLVGLLDHLGIEAAHVFGHSTGAAVALELAIHHPSRVRSVVPASASVRVSGLHPDLTDPTRMATSTRLPTAEDFAAMQEAYARLSPTPDRFDAFLAKISGANADVEGWTDEQLAGITAPVLLVLGDRDFTTVEHGALMLELIPGAQLAVLPGTTHMQVTRRPDLLLPMLAAFLD